MVGRHGPIPRATTTKGTTMALLTAEQYAKIAESEGVERISWSEFRRRALSLGYRIETRDPCHGTSRMMTGPDAGASWPETSYPAIDTRTGLGFANIHADRSRLAEFQQLRANTVCVSNGRVRSV